MKIGELKKILESLPDEMEIVVGTVSGCESLDKNWGARTVVGISCEDLIPEYEVFDDCYLQEDAEPEEKKRALAEGKRVLMIDSNYRVNK